MAKSGISINLKGFDKMLQNIQAANGDVDRAAQKATTTSAHIVDAELRAAAAASGVPNDLISQIRTHTSKASDKYEAEVGWQLNGYDPTNPSAGYKAIFLNYGTVRRQTRKGYNRGAITKPPRTKQFIYTAKKNAAKKVKAAQKEIYEKVMRDLEK